MSSVDLPRMAALSSLLSFVQKEAKKEHGAGPVGGTRGSVGMVASRRSVTPKREVVAESFLFVEDKVEEVMQLAEGEVKWTSHVHSTGAPLLGEHTTTLQKL